jgi:hypothetical protein
MGDLRPRVVALAADDRPSLRPLLRAVAGLNLNLETVGTAAELAPAVARHTTVAVLVDQAALGADGQARCAAAVAAGAQQVAPPALILLTEGALAGLEDWFDCEWFAHLHPVAGAFAVEGLTATLARLTGQPLFGAERWLPWGTHCTRIGLGGSPDRQPALNRVAERLGAVGVAERLQDRLLTVVDELITNAVYDAPIDRASGAPRHRHQDRRQPVVLDAADQPELSFGTDGVRFAVAVRDPFGGLRAETVRQHLARGLRRGADQIDQKQGGAGLGLFLLFDHLHALSVEVHPGRRTEVAGLVDLRGGHRAVLAVPRRFDLFVRRGI